MMRTALLAGLLIAGGTGGNAQAPQRTIITTPTAVHSDSSPNPAPAAPDASDSALEKYREMWRKMSPAQQKAFVDSGGYTPEQYERLLKPKAAASAAGAGTDPRTKIDPTMDALNKSLQNLDTIRDANLGRVQAESCPPEVAARIADLRAKLRTVEPESSEVPAGTGRARSAPITSPGDPLATATDWYKPGAPAAQVNKATQQGKLLAEVLPGVEAAAPKPAVNEQDITRAKAELEQLAGACGAPIR